jgi:probable rRNA maturation factor
VRKKNNITIFNLLPQFKFPHKDAVRLVQQVMGFFCLQAENINVVFMNNKKIRRLNNDFLSHDYPTDVISFRFNAGKSIEGEIYIGVEVARENSLKFRTGFHEEIRRLITHGTLHLAGFKDKTKNEKKNMTNREDFFLNKFSGSK